MSSEQSGHKRQWRDYQTESGARPIKDFLLALPDEDRAAILEEIEKENMNGTGFSGRDDRRIDKEKPRIARFNGGSAPATRAAECSSCYSKSLSNFTKRSSKTHSFAVYSSQKRFSSLVMVLFSIASVKLCFLGPCCWLRAPLLIWRRLRARVGWLLFNMAPNCSLLTRKKAARRSSWRSPRLTSSMAPSSNFFHTSMPRRSPRAAFAMLRPRCMRSSRRLAATSEPPKTRSRAAWVARWVMGEAGVWRASGPGASVAR